MTKRRSNVHSFKPQVQSKDRSLPLGPPVDPGDGTDQLAWLCETAKLCSTDAADVRSPRSASPVSPRAHKQKQYAILAVRRSLRQNVMLLPLG
jgi:hypothetical protein